MSPLRCIVTRQHNADKINPTVTFIFTAAESCAQLEQKVNNVNSVMETVALCRLT